MSKATITLIDTDDGGLEIEFSCKETEENSRALNISKSMMRFLLNNVEGAKEEKAEFTLINTLGEHNFKQTEK